MYLIKKIENVENRKIGNTKMSISLFYNTELSLHCTVVQKEK